MADDRQYSRIDDFVDRIKARQHNAPDPEQLFDALKAGEHSALSRAITLVESRRPEDLAAAMQLLERCLKERSEARRIAVTGTPGVGKSTFINRFVRQLADGGRKVAVLSVDPSSSVSRGSILGDKTRMDDISNLEQVFIRPSPSGEMLGGVHEKTREAILLCETAGFDRILIETVGVGQSEYMVQRMCDLFLLLLLPGGGDELQGIKRGIMEAADIVLLNKSDLFGKDLLRKSISDFRQALHLSAAETSEWTTRIESCSSLADDSIQKVIGLTDEFFRFAESSGRLQDRRGAQWKMWFDDSLGWAVKETLRERGKHLRNYLPAPDELPPAKALTLIHSLFR